MTNPIDLAENIKKRLVVVRHFMEQYYYTKAETEVRTSVYVSGSRPQGQKLARERLEEKIIPVLNISRNKLNTKINELITIFQKAKESGSGYTEAKTAVIRVMNNIIEVMPSVNVYIKPSMLQGDADLLKILRKKTKTRIKVLKKDKEKIEKRLKKLVRYMKRYYKSRYKTFKAKGLKRVLHMPQENFSIGQNQNIRIDIYKLDDLEQRIKELERLLTVIKSSAKRHKTSKTIPKKISSQEPIKEFNLGSKDFENLVKEAASEIKNEMKKGFKKEKRGHGKQFCGKCGNKLKGNETFCGKCGNRL